jgi:hypothetical protein
MNFGGDQRFKSACKVGKPFFVLGCNKKYISHGFLSSIHPILPQHEPGPAHPAAPGEFPQQVVSPAPGSAWPVRPVRELVADISFSVRVLPQPGQTICVSLPVTMTSLTRPHSWHAIS